MNNAKNLPDNCGGVCFLFLSNCLTLVQSPNPVRLLEVDNHKRTVQIMLAARTRGGKGWGEPAPTRVTHLNAGGCWFTQEWRKELEIHEYSPSPPPLPWKPICSLLNCGSKPDGAMKRSLESGPVTVSISSYNNGFCT